MNLLGWLRVKFKFQNILKLKTFYYDILELDMEELVSNARLRRYLICWLWKEFMPFISSVQGWANQPFIIELKNMLSNQEVLVKRMSSSRQLNQVEDDLFIKDEEKEIHYQSIL